MTIVIYGSRYGTARKYAEALADRTNAVLKPCDEADDIDQYDVIVYLGALYAGGVLGMKKTFRKNIDYEGKKIIIATVGLADPEDAANTDHIKAGMKSQLPESVFNQAAIVHLRGGIDYSILDFKHKTMMSLLYRKAKSLPEEKKNAEVKAMIETYNKKADFVDLDKLDLIVKMIQDKQTEAEHA